MATETRLLTGAEAARILRIPTGRLSRLTRAGRVPHVELPDRELRYDRDDLDKWIDENKRGTDGQDQ